MMGRRSAFLVLAAVAAACTPVAAGPSTTTASTTTSSVVPGQPVIASFSASPGTAVAPALVALAWSVSDPQGDPLTCTIDADGNGVVDLTVADCQTPGSRNVTIASAGTVQARLTASDATSSAQATTPITTTAGPSETYDIVLRPQSAVSAPIQSAFDAAAARWETIVVRGVPDRVVNVSANACGAVNGALNALVDDLVIDISVVSIDGPGNVLAEAGPCIYSSSDGLTRFGIMEFDSSDVAGLVSSGQLTDVVTHEMGHVLGFGTLWDVPLLTGAGTADPRFTGSRAGAEWSALGRSGTVPVENTGGSGTADGHWREANFGNELMTGYINAGVNPLSSVSIGSLADLGYQVDITRADAFTPPNMSGLKSAFQRAPAPIAPDEILLHPIGSV